MKLLLRGVGLALLWVLSSGMTSGACDRLRAAHTRLLEGSFALEREFSLSINGEPKRRQLARLTSTDGELVTEVVEEEVLSRGLVLDGKGGELALGIPFSCERVEALGSGRFELTSEDGLERVEFELDPRRDALLPLRWRLEARERFLFKKLLIEGSAEYRGFRWLESPAGAADRSRE